MSENFDIKTEHDNNDDQVEMSVSPVCEKDGKKYAFVTFKEGTKNAEGRIPECIIEKNEGFSDEEVQALCDYMKAELPTLKKTAASLNVFDAFRK